MCSKHVEAWNKLIIKFSASSWLILINKYIEMHGQQNITKKKKTTFTIQCWTDMELVLNEMNISGLGIYRHKPWWWKHSRTTKQHYLAERWLYWQPEEFQSIYWLSQFLPYVYLHLLDVHTAIVTSGSVFPLSLLGHRWSPAVVFASRYYSAELHLSLLVDSSNYWWFLPTAEA